MPTKTMSAWEVRRNFGKVLRDVIRDHQAVIVESYGEPIAAVVPLNVYERYEDGVRRLIEVAEAAAAQAELNRDEAMDIAIREIAAYHAEKRQAEAERVAGGH
jgi:prevent-host-death family protein